MPADLDKKRTYKKGAANFEEIEVKVWIAPGTSKKNAKSGGNKGAEVKENIASSIEKPRKMAKDVKASEDFAEVTELGLGIIMYPWIFLRLPLS